MKNIKQRLVTLALSSSIVLGTGVFSFADETTQDSTQVNGTLQAGAIVNKVEANGNGNSVSAENTVTNENKTVMNAAQGTSDSQKPEQKPEQKPAEKPAEKPEQKPEQKPAEKPDEDASDVQEPGEKPEQKPAEKPEGDKTTQESTQANGTVQIGGIYSNVSVNGNNNYVNVSNSITNINNTYMNAYQSTNSTSKTPSKVTPKKVNYTKSTAKVTNNTSKSTAKVTNNTSNPKTGDESLAVAAVGLLGAGSMLVARRKSEN